MLVSTGLADLREVALAVDAIAGAGDPPLALLHCVSAYPAEPADANLRAIATLRAAFGVPTGWSDHMRDGRVAIASVAAGGALVEKHLTLGRGRSGPDHAASIEPDEFRDLVAEIRLVEAALGTGTKVPTDAERPIAAIARKSLHWADSLPAGAVVTPSDLVAMRPGTGLSPGDMPRIVGRATRRAVQAGTLVSEADLADVDGDS
jgi:sialic acid synthase SpsE